MKAFPQLCLLVLFCAFFTARGFAQITTQIPPENALSARQLLDNARVSLDSNQFLKAEVSAEAAYNFFKKNPEAAPADLAEAAYLTGLAAFQGEKHGGAIPFFEEAVQIWTKLFPEGSRPTANALHYWAICLYQRSKPDKAAETCRQALEMRQKLLPPNHLDLAESWRWLGNIHLELGRYLKGLEYYENALEIEKISSGAESARVADVLGNIGYAWTLQGNPQKSIAMQEQALAIRQKLLPADHLDLAYSYHTLGMAYKSIQENEVALQYFEKTLAIRIKQLGENNMDVANTCSETGQAYFGLRDYPKARIFFERANQIMVELKATNQSAYGYVCADLGQVNLQLKNYPAAIEWHQKNVNFRRGITQKSYSPLAGSLIQLGNAKLANDDFEGAIADFQEAKQIWEKLFGPLNKNGAKADASLGNAYRKWFLKTKSHQLLEQARAHYQLAEKAIEESMRTETSPEVLKKALSESVPVFEKAISTELYDLKNQADAETRLENAWQLSETMHSYLLFSATQEANARHFAGIPDEELIRDSLLRTQITALEKSRRSLIETKKLSLSDSLVLAASLQISAKKEEKQALQKLFESEYPEYYRLKYQRQTSSLAYTQAQLSEDQTLLEYFVGDSIIFVFVVQHEGSQVLEIPRNFPLLNWVQDLREGISNYHQAKQKAPDLYPKTVRQYASAAQLLYEKLVAPIASSLKPEIIFIPGDGMANLPLEALLTAAPKDLSSFNTYPFLLRKHSVQYAYSATMLHQMMARQARNTPSGDLLAFAPFFEGDASNLAAKIQGEQGMRRGFSELPYSGEEVFRAKMRFSGTSEVFTGAQATKQKFQELAARYRVLHLATHGKANAQAGDFSYLAFSTTDGSSLISAGELYNLTLNADLVLLSACETGLGEQKRGEGVISLARAFAYAGAKSIVASLWSVNDQSTMQIMDRFYQEMQAGKSKNLALAAAKRWYLEQNPGQNAHPFFWAGFVGLGDFSVLKI